MHFCLSVLLIFSYTCIIMWCIWFTACWLNIICINIKVWCVNLNTLRLWLWEVLGILIPLFDCSFKIFTILRICHVLYFNTEDVSWCTCCFCKTSSLIFHCSREIQLHCDLVFFFFSVIHDLFTKLFTCNCTALSNFWK